MTAGETAFDMPVEAKDAAVPPAAIFARLEIHHGADAAVLEAWAALETIARCSIYQTRAWLLPWIENVGRMAAISPVFVIARAGDGTPTVLLCLGLRRRGPVTVASFLGGKDSNFHIPLVRPDIRAAPQDWSRLFHDAAHLLGRKAPDAFLFMNQPREWAGQPNPLAALPWQPSPSAAVGTHLPSDTDDLFRARLSKEARRKLRRKRARLAQMGPLRHLVAASASERTMVLDAFFAQKLDRFRAQRIGSSFEGGSMRSFLQTASAGGPYGAGLELHALLLGDRVVAVYGGGAHHGQWSGMVNSFDPDPEIAKSSPGDLLLMAVMEMQCRKGLTRFDLGIGEARYKSTFCDEIIPLFDTFLPLTFKGRISVRAESLALRLKRAVKQNPVTFTLAKRIRTFKLWR